MTNLVRMPSPEFTVSDKGPSTEQWANPSSETSVDKPSAAGKWPIDEIVSKLSRPLPSSMLNTKSQGGRQIKFITWSTVSRVLDKYAPGWTWEVREFTLTDSRIFLLGRLTIPALEGNVSREATGTELLYVERPLISQEETTVYGDNGLPIMQRKELPYGDPSSNAESMAFRRAAARFGLGLYLYDKRR